MVTRLRKSERGVALLAVLLGIALMTLIVVDFAMTSGLGFVSASNQANELRATYLARSGINIGLGLLAADARSKAMSQSVTQTPCESLQDVWAMPFPPTPLEGGVVTLSIVDEDRKLNINSMIQNGAPNQLAMLRMQRLFTILDVNVDLVQGIIDWINPEGANSGGGGDYYLGLTPPYQPRYGPMPTIGDLQMVKGFNEEVFNRVSPFLTAAPVTAVNINTAAPQVIASLEPELMEDQKTVAQILEARAIRPFSNPSDLPDEVPGVATFFNDRLQKDIGTKSQFFTIYGTGTYAGARKLITATFHREQNGIGTLAAWHED